MPQLTYPRTMARGFAGQLSGVGPSQKGSYVNGEVSAEIPFGAGVMQGATDEKCVLPATGDTAAKFRGVVLKVDVYEKPVQLGDTGIKIKVPVSVLEQGRCLVEVEEAVTKGDRAFLRITTSGDDVPGQWRKSADSGKAIELKGVRYTESADAGAIVEIEVDVAVTRALV